MRLYMANTNTHWFVEASKQLVENGHEPVRYLMSYYYYRTKDMNEHVARCDLGTQPLQLWADSGAFSAHSLGGAIHVDEYAQWLIKWKHHFEYYANLDVKGDVDAGLRNQERLESYGLKPIPVFHGGEPWEVLEYLISKYPYIALGGLTSHARSGGDAMGRFLRKCFEMAEGRSVYHGFGMTNVIMMANFPWYSVDSTSWSSGYMYGRVPLYVPDKIIINIRLADRKRWGKHAQQVRRLGFDPWFFADRKQYHHYKACRIGAESYALAERHITRRWGEITIPQRAQ